MNPEQYVQQKAAASGSSFYYAFLFLPAPRRAAITAFYAFCREIDDVVDEVSDASVAGTVRARPPRLRLASSTVTAWPAWAARTAAAMPPQPAPMTATFTSDPVPASSRPARTCAAA